MTVKTHQPVQPANQVADEAKELLEEAGKNPWIERMTRLGYAVRGLIYGLIGFLAIQLIFTGRGQITDQTGALATIAAQPFGKALLIVIAIGLVGLVLWSIVRAVADPYHKGSDWKGLVARAGYIVSAISYAILLFPTLSLIRGAGQKASGTQQAQNLAAGILTHPWGRWVLGLVGAAFIAVGIYEIYRGWNAKFDYQFNVYRLSAEQRRWTIRMGRIGTAALGVVLGTIGFLAVLAARTLDPQKVGGLDGALLFLSRQPYGPWILALVALGLLAYAAYSIMGALWFRFRTP